jgi:hypothetical protein
MPRSNPGPWFHHKRCTMARAVGATRDGGSRWRHGQQRWCAGLGPRARYDSPNPIQFVPTVSQRDGDSGLLTFKQRWAAWRVGGGDFLCKNSADGVGLLRRLSSLTKTTCNFPFTSSSFPLRWISSGGGGFLRTKILGLEELWSILGKIWAIHDAILGVSTWGRRWKGLQQLSRSQRTQPIEDSWDRSMGIKFGLNRILFGYELGSGFGFGF